MSRGLGETSGDTRCERNVFRRRVKWGRWQHLPLKVSRFLTDMAELGEEFDGDGIEQTLYSR